MPVRKAAPIGNAMATSPEERIEQALARIEAAAASRGQALDRLTRRHAKLRARIQDAVTSLDALVARESGPAAEAEDA